jgi:integrase
MRVRAMRRVFNWAMKQQPPLARTNPARDVGYLRRGSEGHHCWTLDEIRQYEKRHPSGTKARPALALFLYTGQRRSDVVRLGRQHSTRSGWFRFTQHKDRNRNPVTLEIPILPVLQKEIEAAPTGDLTFLVTEYGRPYSIKGFGAKMRQWCEEAGLPERCTAHGLRKAGAVRAAENGATAHQLMAIFGRLTLAEAERYTRAVRQKLMAGEAMGLLSRTKEG